MPASSLSRPKKNLTPWYSARVLTISVGRMRPVFCGNFDFETRHSDLERLFSKYGRVERIDMKSGMYLSSIVFELGDGHESPRPPYCGKPF
ncbi:hypothetical protein ACLOJK_004974 [Asimina triloba]